MSVILSTDFICKGVISFKLAHEHSELKIIPGT